MRTSQFHISTSKETPASAEIVSHQLMLRAGMIRQLASGLYNWLPMGLRVLRKVERIVREEMDRAGAMEMLMPVVQPAELWQQSGRWDKYGPELLRFQDRHKRDFCLGPTHEEVITDLICREIRGPRQLPANFYQIQTKFRDEIRPRFGVMRAREFLMKDAYSFHLTKESLEETYQRMYDAYHRIFGRIGLDFRAVQADTGSIGGNYSHEFHVLADAGEDAIVFSSDSDYAANMEMAVSLPPPPRAKPSQAFTRHEGEMDGNVDWRERLKIQWVHGLNTELVALVLRQTDEPNTVKIESLPQVAKPLRRASSQELISQFGSPSPSLFNVKCVMIVEQMAAALSDFACPGETENEYYTGVNWGRDLAEPVSADFRNVTAGEPSPDGKGNLRIARGIEVGHIFQLGTTYSKAMGAKISDESGNDIALIMGCYGIGVSRIVAASIEQNHDERGIIWPQSIAPYEVALLPMQMQKSAAVREATESLYQELLANGIDVLMDDRGLRPGVMFADMELIGIPHRLVIGDRGLDEGKIEYQGRRDEEAVMLNRDSVVSLLKSKLGRI